MTTGKTGIFMKETKHLNLRLFDGEGGAAPASAATPTNAEVTTAAEPDVGYKSRRQAAAERERMAKNALLGKSEPVAQAVKQPQEAAKEQPKEEPAETAKTAESQAETPTKKSGAEQLDEMMKDSEFRKAFSEKAQAIIDQRFKEYKGLQAKIDTLEPIIEALTEKYGTEKDDIQALAKAFSSDGDVYAALGEKHGLSGEQYKTMKDFQRTARNEQRLRMEIESQLKTQEAARKIQAESELVKKIYTDFDLQTTLSDPRVREMLKSGVSLKAAYEAANIDKIIQQRTMATEKQVVENIQARGARPVEGGASSQTGAVSQNLARKLTKQERENLAQRAIRGEKITLH